jgi:hypothetical protein
MPIDNDAERWAHRFARTLPWAEFVLGLLLLLSLGAKPATLFAIPPFDQSQRALSIPMPTSQREWQRSFDHWRYVGSIDEDGYVNAQVMLDSETVTGIKSYAVANRTLADQLWQTGQQAMQAEVIFRHPIAIADLTALRNRLGITIQSVEGRINSANGDRETVTWVVSSQADLSSSVLDNAKADISTKSGSAQFAGIYSFKGVLSRTGYYQLVSEPGVFLIDVTANQIQRDMGTNIAADKLSTITGPSTFWKMEDLGLTNFQ